MDSRLLATFRSAPSTLGPTPGVREAWHQGRSVYAVWVLRVLDAPILERMALVNARLAPHGVRPFGEAHVTVFVAGFPARAPGRDDDVSIDALLAPLGTVGRDGSNTMRTRCRRQRFWRSGESSTSQSPRGACSTLH